VELRGQAGQAVVEMLVGITQIQQVAQERLILVVAVALLVLIQAY
jgi:hypothetical protein